MGNSRSSIKIDRPIDHKQNKFFLKFVLNMAVGKNKGLSKGGKKGVKKKM